MNDNQRKAIFAMLEKQRKNKEAQIAVTMQISDWEMKDEK